MESPTGVDDVVGAPGLGLSVGAGSGTLGFCLNPFEVARSQDLARVWDEHETVLCIYVPLWQHWIVAGGAQVNVARVSGLRGFAVARVEDDELTAKR